MTVALLSVATYVYQVVREVNPAPQRFDTPRFVADKPEPATAPESDVADQPKKSLPPPVINAGASRIRWASAKETSVLWNIDREVFIDDKREDLIEFQEITGDAVLPSTYEFARSVPKPPPYVTETPEVIQSGLSAVREYLHKHQIKPLSDLCEFIFEEEHFFSYLGKTDERDYSTDRTLTILVKSPSLFRPDFVEMIQRSFLAKWPLWRVYLIGFERDGEEHLLIYPHRIFIGATEYSPEEMDEPIRNWQASLERIREPEAGPQRRQFAHLLPLLPTAAAKLKTESIVLLAAFDSCCGDLDEHSMWFLYPRNMPVSVTTPKEYSHGHRYIYVNTKGKIVPDEDSESLYVIEEIGLSASDIGNVELTIGRTPRPWKSPATSDQIVKDTDLRKTESAGGPKPK